MQTFRYIFRTEQAALIAKAQETYGFDAFYSWFLSVYGDSLTEYEQQNMHVNRRQLETLFKQHSIYYRQYHTQ